MLNRRGFVLSGIAAGVLGAPALAQTSRYVANHPLYEPSLALMKDRKWQELVSSIDALPPQSAYSLLRDIGEGSPIANNLNDLAKVRGGASIAGAIHVGWAWRYRGKDLGVTDEKGFEKHLVAAADLLTDAAEKNIDDGLATTFLIRVMKGGGETEAVHTLLPAFLAAKRRPVEGFAVYADAVSEKWVGTEAEAIAFARKYTGAAPPASYGLIADTHLNAAGARTMSDDPKVVASADTYFNQKDVVAEIIAAHESFQAAAADPDRFAMLVAHSQFSLAFVQLQDAKRAHYHLSAQGGFTGGAWHDIDNRAEVLSQIRAAVGLGPI